MFRALPLTLLLAACGSGTIVRDRPVSVNVPVVQPCVEGQRPAKVVALKDQALNPPWNQRDVRQKAATVGKQGLERQTYAEQLDAATGACP